LYEVVYVIQKGLAEELNLRNALRQLFAWQSSVSGTVGVDIEAASGAALA
jgi:hypothetical protein